MATARDLWIDQYEAAWDIRERFGVKAAFDYIVGEKLQAFAVAAAHDRQLAADLPQFVAEARRLFTPEEISSHLGRLERQLIEDPSLSGIRLMSSLSVLSNTRSAPTPSRQSPNS